MCVMLSLTVSGGKFLVVNLLLYFRCGKYGRLTPAEFASVRRERLNVMRIVVPPAVSTLYWSTINKSFDMH